MLIAFHLGRVFTLSLAELISVLDRKGVSFKIADLYTEVLVIETDQTLDYQSLQRRLGGVVKIMEVVDVLPRNSRLESLSAEVKNYFHPNILKSHFLKQVSGKLQFGLSIYVLSRKIHVFGQNKRIGMEIKKSLQTEGISCRLVIPEGAAYALPSVVVTNNLLLEKGCEIDLVVSDSKIYVAKTQTVQDFVDYGRRDYQRPLRDAKVGMIPPKVAQEMINLAQVPDEARLQEAFILDPFCGSGTILQEAMLSGYKVFGTDFSQKAIDDAEQNLGWIRTRYKLPLNRYELACCDIKDLVEAVSDKTIVAVVTEGTLGPAYVTPPSQKMIEKNFKDLGKIYLKAFEQFKKILKTGSRVVVALPAYHKIDGYVSFPMVDKILAAGYDIVAPISGYLQKKYPFLKVTPRNSIIYDRKDQIVVREIMILQVK